MTYWEKFDSAREARQFASNCAGLRSGYSINITPGGKGSKSYAVIKKTKEFYENKVKQYQEVEKEHMEIENILKANNYSFKN